MSKIWDRIKGRLDKLMNDILPIVSFLGTAYFLFYVFFPEMVNGLNTLFKWGVSVIIAGLIINAILDLLVEGMKYLSDNISLYISNIREITSMKREIQQMRLEMEKLNIEVQKQEIIIEQLKGAKTQ